MSFQDEKDDDRRRKAASGRGDGAPGGASGRRSKPPADVGDALRNAYHRTVQEDIPPEMLDLLGKLS